MTIRTHTGAVEKQWAVLYFATVGLAAGFLGSLVKLVSNMIGASIMALDPLKLLRVYATIKEGSAALVPNNGMLIVLGKLPARADLMKMLQQRFGDWKQHPIPASPATPCWASTRSRTSRSSRAT